MTLLDELRERLVADRSMDGDTLDIARQRLAATEASRLDTQLLGRLDFDARLLMGCLADDEPGMRLYAAQTLLTRYPASRPAALAIRVLQDFATGAYGHGSMSIDAKETLRVAAKRLRESATLVGRE